MRHCFFKKKFFRLIPSELVFGCSITLFMAFGVEFFYDPDHGDLGPFACSVLYCAAFGSIKDLVSTLNCICGYGPARAEIVAPWDA